MANSISTYRKAIKKIAANLNLKDDDKHSQDWEYEVADPNRIEDFWQFYMNNKLDTVEKRIIIKLLLESYNDYIGENGFKLDYTKKIKKILEKEKTLCEDIIRVWSCEEEKLEDAFYITPIVREIAKNI